MEKVVRVYLPKWVVLLYGVLAIILIPWIFNLANSLPAHHFTNHWDLVWVGFDIILLGNIFLTLYFMIQQRVWAIISASSLATLFIIDAWFDIVTSRPGREQRISIVFGLVEVTLGILTYWLVFRVVHSSVPEKNVRLVHKTKNSQ